MRIIFAGSIGRLPVGGHAWVDMQYLLGLRALGHEVFYLEECGPESWVYNWHTEEMTTDLEYPSHYVRQCLEPVGFGRQWIYRAGEESRGAHVEALVEMCSAADLMIVRAVGVPLWRPEYERPARRIFIDMDPAFTQIHLARGKQELVETVDRCDRLFTIGQRLGDPDCPVPLLGREWIKTLPPVFLPEWPWAEDAATHFTSILQWRSYREVEHAGVRYGNKDKEFPQFIDLPQSAQAKFELALTGAPPKELIEHGWDITEGWRASETPEAYRRYIQRSLAEFGVAKQGYVATRCGWFSDRSVCYLASGRPILLQDTGLGDWLPVGRGIVTFASLDEAARGAEAVIQAYPEHRQTARKLAEEYFSTDRVLAALLEAALS